MSHHFHYGSWSGVLLFYDNKSEILVKWFTIFEKWEKP